MGNKRIAFTLCSNNYLAQAKTLGDSLLKNNPDYLFFIGLVDKFNPEIDYTIFKPYQVIEIESIKIPDFNNLINKYNIVELNTAVKPFFFLYLLNRYPDCDQVIYFDPDILVTHRLTSIEEALTSSNVLLTPHILSPIGVDDLSHGEDLFLKYGIYNLGFIGIRRTDESVRFLDWWKDRTFHLGFSNSDAGTFVDQKWINLVPLLFEGISISRHVGLNAAFWNLHERTISERNGVFFINKTTELVFYHFSQFNPNKNDIASNHNRYSFENRPDTIPLFRLYREKLLANRYNYFKAFSCHYVAILQEIKKNRFMEKVKQRDKKMRFSWLIKLIYRWVSTSTVLIMKAYLDYLLDLKTLFANTKAEQK